MLSTQLRDQFQRQPRELAHSFGHIAGELNIILGLCDQAHRSRDVRFCCVGCSWCHTSLCHCNVVRGVARFRVKLRAPRQLCWHALKPCPCSVPPSMWVRTLAHGVCVVLRSAGVPVWHQCPTLGTKPVPCWARLRRRSERGLCTMNCSGLVAGLCTGVWLALEQLL